MALDLTNVESFVALAEHRHFGKAASALGVTVSTVTKRLQRLEDALGVPLVLRNSAGFGGLTPAGQRFVEVAPELLRTARTASDVAIGEPRLTLRIAIPAGVSVLAPLLPAALGTLELALQHSYSGVSVLAVPTPFGRLTSDLVDGEVDVVLTFGVCADPAVASTRLAALHRVGVVASTHPFARRHAMPAAEFARQPMIYTPGLPDEYMHPFILADVRPLTDARLVPLHASTAAHVAQRLLQGREVTIVPLALTANLPPEMVRILLSDLPKRGSTPTTVAPITAQNWPQPSS